jgi:hypothetical protein
MKEDFGNIPEKVTLVFITPQVNLAEHVWAELDAIYVELFATYGKAAASVMDIQVHCTARDKADVAALTAAVTGTALFDTGALRFTRPDFESITMRPLLTGMYQDAFMGSGRPSYSDSLVTFCGSTQLGSLVSAAVSTSNARVKVIGSNHNLDFLQENYGQATPKKKPVMKPKILVPTASIARQVVPERQARVSQVWISEPALLGRRQDEKTSYVIPPRLSHSTHLHDGTRLDIWRTSTTGRAPTFGEPTRASESSTSPSSETREGCVAPVRESVRSMASQPREVRSAGASAPTHSTPWRESVTNLEQRRSRI